MRLDTGCEPSGATIRVEYKLAEPPAKVWRALTEPALLSVWLMPTDIRAEVGHCFTFRGQPRPGWDGVVYCEVLDVVPQQRLVYSWRGGSSKQEEQTQALDTIVTWTLVPTPAGGTTLLLEHAGFEPEGFAFKTMSQGWSGKIAARMSEVIAGLS